LLEYSTFCFSSVLRALRLVLNIAPSKLLVSYTFTFQENLPPTALQSERISHAEKNCAETGNGMAEPGAADKPKADGTIRKGNC
jgi:hypothetical protein